MVLICNIYGNSFFSFKPDEDDEYLVVMTERGSMAHCVINSSSMIEGSSIHYEKANRNGKMCNHIVSLPKSYSESQWEIIFNNESEEMGRRIITLNKLKW